jgi:hypothetical protein
MVALKLPIFSGMVPSIDDYLLADQNAAYAKDTWLYSGALVGLPTKAALHTLANPQATIAYRVPRNDSDPSYLYDSLWMEFENSDTDFISAPVSADQYQRFYWTSTSQVPVYNTLPRMIAGDPPWLLGVPQPANISVVPSGGVSGTLVSRAYVTTLVTEYGEEGPASTPALANGKIDDTFAVTIGGVPATDLGVTRNVKKIRLYRTIVSAAGTVTYYMVAEVVALTTPQVYNDVMPDNVLASKPILESTAWTEPPDLDGIIAMPNGIMAGYVGNELWFSEAYRPHAWPAAYSLSLEHDVVGLGIINQSLVVCTKGNPVTATGVNPASITTSKISQFEPCLSKGSILSTEEGVYYTSPTGLVLVNAGFAQNITKQFISRDKWNGLVNQAKINAARLGSAYYGFGAGVQRIAQEDAFQQDMIQTEVSTGSSDGFLLDPSNTNVGFIILADSVPIKSVYNDPFSGELLIVRDGKVFWLDQRPGYKTDPYLWRSKIFQTPVILNFSAFKVYFNDIEGFVTPNPQNFDKNQEYDPLTQKGVIRIYANGELLLAYELRTSGELFRVPSGQKYETWQIEFEGMVKIRNFQMATSVKELSVV